MSKILIGWTTVETEKQAQELAQGVVTNRLVACAQIDGPITSFYSWEGKVENSQEYRLMLKFPETNLKALETWLSQNHPYDTPQWLALPATSALEEYANWVTSTTAVKTNP